MRLHVHSAKQLVVVCQNGEKFLRKSDLSKYVVLNQKDEGKEADGLSVIVDANGRIADVGWTSEVSP